MAGSIACIRNGQPMSCQEAALKVLPNFAVAVLAGMFVAKKSKDVGYGVATAALVAVALDFRFNVESAPAPAPAPAASGA